MKTTICILSYNNPSMTDRLFDNLNSTISTSHNMVVYDNGSDADKISKHTTHRGLTNCRMVGGFNEIIKIVNNEYTDSEYFWFFTNDCYFVTKEVDVLDNMLKKFNKYPDIGILHPSLHQDVSCEFSGVKNTKTSGLQIVNMYDFVCPMISKKCLDSVGKEFNKDFYVGWGVDWETSYLARSKGFKVAINNELIVMHNTSTTYDNHLDSIYPDRNSYYNSALKDMYSVLIGKYGSDWHNKFCSEYSDKVGEWYE